MYGRGAVLGVVLAAGAALAEAWPDVAAPLAGAGGGELDAALVVGVERYAFVPGVPGAARNADDWYAFLARSRKVPVGSIKLLRDSEATLEKLKKYAQEAAARVKPGGTLWFVFVGHGAPSKDGKDGVLVGADAQQDADSLFARSLPQAELLALLEKGGQARSLLFVDACFSGRTGTGKALVEGLQPVIALRAGTSVKGRTVLLTAGASDQFAGPLPGEGRPAFSYLALGGLRGWADLDGDGTVTAQELVDYLGDALRSLLKDRTQTPQLYSERPKEPLAKASEKGPDLVAKVLGTPAQPPAHPTTPALSAPRIEVVRAVGSINLKAEQLLDVANELEQRKGAAPSAKAQAWCALAAVKGESPYASSAQANCTSWRDFAAQVTRLLAKLPGDFEVLWGYAQLNRTKDEKLAAADAFLKTYAPVGDSALLQRVTRLRDGLALGAPDFFLFPPAEKGAVSATGQGATAPEALARALGLLALRSKSSRGPLPLPSCPARRTGTDELKSPTALLSLGAWTIAASLCREDHADRELELRAADGLEVRVTGPSKFLLRYGAALRTNAYSADWPGMSWKVSTTVQLKDSLESLRKVLRVELHQGETASFAMAALPPEKAAGGPPPRAPKPNYPEWVNRGSGQFGGEKGQVLLGVGIGDLRALATLRAVAEVGKIREVLVGMKAKQAGRAPLGRRQRSISPPRRRALRPSARSSTSRR